MVEYDAKRTREVKNLALCIILLAFLDGCYEYSEGEAPMATVTKKTLKGVIQSVPRSRHMAQDV